MLGRAVALLGLALALAAWSAPAHAHASLIEATPADGAVVAVAPEIVRLRFNEPVSPLVLRLFDADGRSRDGLPATARDHTLEVTLPRDLAPGTLALSYRVISSDGHPIGGTIAFSIGAPSGRPDAAPAGGDPQVAFALWLARFILHLGFFVGVGGAFFAAWIAPGAMPRLGLAVAIGALAAGLAAAVVAVGLQGLDALAAPLPGLGGGIVWTAGLQTSFGATAIAAGLALLCSLLSLLLPGAARALSAAGLLACGGALALSGHAAAAEPQWLTRPAVFAHGVGVASWVGALVPLGLLVLARRGDALPIVRRFSAWAVPGVLALVAAGAVLTVVQVGDGFDLVESAYGQILAAKLIAALALLALAGVNRVWLTPALEQAAPRPWLARSIAAETVLAVAIVGLAGLWRFTPPPRTLVPAPAVALHIHTPQVMADLTLAPGRAGGNRATLALATGDAAPLEPKEVTLILSNESAGIEPIERRAARAGDVWQIDGLFVPVQGRWQVRIDVLISDFDKAILEGAVDVPR